MRELDSSADADEVEWRPGAPPPQLLERGVDRRRELGDARTAPRDRCRDRSRPSRRRRSPRPGARGGRRARRPRTGARPAARATLSSRAGPGTLEIERLNSRGLAGEVLGGAVEGLEPGQRVEEVVELLGVAVAPCAAAVWALIAVEPRERIRLGERQVDVQERVAVAELRLALVAVMEADRDLGPQPRQPLAGVLEPARAGRRRRRRGRRR